MRDRDGASVLHVGVLPFHSGALGRPLSCLVFVDGQTYKTRELPQSATCKFLHEHVFLVGKGNDHISLREKFATKVIHVYLHDNDEECEDDPEREYTKGVAKFTLRDFLRPFCKEIKLRSDVFPCKRVNEDNTTLDLNTSARKQERSPDKLNPYLMNATYCVITATLAH